MMIKIPTLIFAAIFSLKPLPSDEGALEPSIQNEVDYAVSKAEKWLNEKKVVGEIFEVSTNGMTNVTALVGDVFSQTNGKTRVQMAVHFISSQRSEGWWVTPTNSAPTKAALQILKGL